MNIKAREINEEFIHTWETMDKIEEQYVTEDCSLSKQCRDIVEYLNRLPAFDRQVFYLYAEYGSYRKVATETTVNKDIIAQTVNRIKKDVKSGKYIN